MAKKTATKKATPAKKAAPAKKPAPAKKAPAAKSSKKSHDHAAHADHEDCEMVELDAKENAALDLADSSEALRNELEAGLIETVSSMVRNVYKKHKIDLSKDQSINVTCALFFDDEDN